MTALSKLRAALAEDRPADLTREEMEAIVKVLEPRPHLGSLGVETVEGAAVKRERLAMDWRVETRSAGVTMTFLTASQFRPDLASVLAWLRVHGIVDVESFSSGFGMSPVPAGFVWTGLAGGTAEIEEAGSDSDGLRTIRIRVP